MHTLLLTDAFLPHAGGSRIYYYNLYSRLVQEHGERVTVLTRKFPGWQAFDSQLPVGLRIRRFGRRSDHVRVTQWPKLLPYFARTLQLWCFEHGDIIHTGDLFPAGICGALLNRLARIPYLTFCHGEEIPQSQGYRYQPHVRDWIYRNAAVVVANSKFTREKLVEIGIDGSKIHVITPAVDWEHLKPEAKDPDVVRRYNLEDKVVLLTVGRLVRRKGQEMVLAALARLRNRDSVRYIIAGTGEDEQRLKNLTIQLGLGDVVVFTGYVAEDNIPRLFHSCDVFVMPNYQLPSGDLEGFGMVFLEASAAGKPVIAGKSGGTGDSVQDGVTGFLVDPLNPEQLLGRIEQLLTNAELRRTMGCAGRMWACTEFDWKTRAAALHKLNLSIAGRLRAATRNQNSAGEEVCSLIPKIDGARK